MATQVRNINKIKSGMCPHGLPPGACPICSNMGGGSTRVGERLQKAGEMSYHECAMIGNLLKARKLAQRQHTQNLAKQAVSLKIFESATTRASENLKNFIQQMGQNIITKPIAFIAQNLVLPIINFVQNIPKFIQKIQNLKFEIQDKLNAIFGEAKNFIQKKIADVVSSIKTNLEGLFKIFKKHNAEDDDTKIDDDKKIFNLKNILHKIIRKKKEKDDNSSKNQQ